MSEPGLDIIQSFVQRDLLSSNLLRHCPKSGIALNMAAICPLRMNIPGRDAGDVWFRDRVLQIVVRDKKRNKPLVQGLYFR